MTRASSKGTCTRKLSMANIETRYAKYLITERGLSHATVHTYWWYVRAFLVHCGEASGVDLETITSRAIGDYVTATASRVSTAGIRVTTSALRSLMRFAFAAGLISKDLSAAVLSEAGLLRRFGAFALHHRQNRVTTALVMQWAAEMNVAAGTAARAVSVVRTFARWRAAEDEHTEVPPARLLPARKRRARPFIHTDEQLMALLEAARGLEPLGGLRGLAYSTLFALISVTGMRISEAVDLNCAGWRPDGDREQVQEVAHGPGPRVHA